MMATDPDTQLVSDGMDRLPQAHQSAAFRLEAQGLKAAPASAVLPKLPLANAISAPDHLEHRPCAIAGRLAGAPR